MAYEYHLTPENGQKVFYDTDNLLKYTIWQQDGLSDAELEAAILAGTAVPQDVSGWLFAWTMRKKTNSPAAIIEKVSTLGIEITGSYNASPGLNTQRVEVQLNDTDTYDPDGSPTVSVKPDSYVYALKRTNDGLEQILVYGKLKLLQAAAWE